MRKSRGSYSWAGSLIHTQREIFRERKIGGHKKYPGVCAGRMRLQDTGGIRGHIARR